MNLCTHDDGQGVEPCFCYRPLRSGKPSTKDDFPHRNGAGTSSTSNDVKNVRAETYVSERPNARDPVSIVGAEEVFSEARRLPREGHLLLCVEGAESHRLPCCFQSPKALGGLAPRLGTGLLELFELLERVRLLGLRFANGFEPFFGGVDYASEVPAVSDMLLKGAPTGGAHRRECDEGTVGDVGAGREGDSVVIQFYAFAVIAARVAFGDLGDEALATVGDHKVQTFMVNNGLVPTDRARDGVLVAGHLFDSGAGGDVVKSDNMGVGVAAGVDDVGHGVDLLCPWGSSPLKDIAV